MGLDMYLSVTKYIGGWNHADEREKAQHRAIVAAAGFGDFRCDESPSATISMTVAYWRKANAIHRWFVERVQGGVDECQSSIVTRDQLRELRDLCRRTIESIELIDGDVKTGRTYCSDGRVEQHSKPGVVVAQKGLAASLLPTQGGFFFGSADYDECYVADVRDTIATLDAVLNDPRFEGCDFYYRASW